jgi:hypothetical protein
MATSHLAFSMQRAQLQEHILIPKFYDPELAQMVSDAAEEFDAPQLGEILLAGNEGSRLGTWIPREYYGSGEIPFVRTSDISHWRIRADFKKGVSIEVYERVRNRQDVQVDDILLVAHGTYLIGTAAIVTAEDNPIVLQDHVFRLRVDPASNVHPLLLLAALSTSFVKRQVRARQFSADIIDKIGERHLGIRIPLPKDQSLREQIVERVGAVIAEQTAIRRDMQVATSAEFRMVRERAATRLGFRIPFGSIRSHILIPKYYDPELEEELGLAEELEPWSTIGQMQDQGLLEVTSGVEPGKLAYGTGPIPFIRTSDLVDWELKLDVRHGVSEDIFNDYQQKGSVESGDILVVRDGTYLVGSSALVGDNDIPALFCGGLLRVRVADGVDRFALLALLNLPLVRRQLRSKQFSRDVIDTLGKRFLEVKIPSLNARSARAVGSQVKVLFARKQAVRQQILALSRAAGPPLKIKYDRPGWSMR